MDITGKSEEFEALWADSLDRAEREQDWSGLDLEEQKARSSRFRQDMNQYGAEDPTAVNRMRTGLYGSSPNSSTPGWSPGMGPEA